MPENEPHDSDSSSESIKARAVEPSDEETQEIEPLASAEPAAAAGQTDFGQLSRAESQTLPACADETAAARLRPASEGETALAVPAEAKKEEAPKVQFELLSETPRAGSIVDLKIKIPYQEYEKKTSDFYKELRQTVVIDGFRRGKAPLRLIQNRYHKEVKEDTLDFLLENTLSQLAEQKAYGVLRQFDRVDPDVTGGQDLEFAISLELRPKIDPTGYEKFEFIVDTVKIDEVAVNAEIEKLQRRHATYQATELMPYTEGNAVTLDIAVRDDKGTEIKELTREDLYLERPNLSLPEPVFQELRGKRAGETFVVRVPEERRSEGGVVLSEQDTYVVKIKEIKLQALPALDDDFAQDVGGLPTMDALREEIRKQLEANEERRVRENSIERIYDQLIQANPFDVPATLVLEARDQMLREYTQRLASAGIRIEDLGDDPADYVLRTQRNAERLLRVILINRAIGDKEKIEATDEDMDRAIAREAEREGRRPLAVRARLEARGSLDRFRQDLKYDLVNDYLLSRAQISKQYVSAEKKILIREPSAE